MVTIHQPLVAFLTPERAEDLTQAGLFADDLDGIRSAYPALGEMWDGTVARARRFDAAKLDERVGGEWSFIETLRHLVMVTDTWIASGVEGEPAPHHPWGMPPDFLPPDAVAAMGLTVEARPSLDEVLAVRDERRARVARVLSELTESDLSRACGVGGGQVQVVGALQVILSEEWSHHQFAIRDLAALEATASE